MKIAEMLKKLSILPHGLRYKLLIAFSLMSIIPLLVIGYLVSSFILLEEPIALGQASMIVLCCIIIAWLGLFLAKGITERVIDVALETRIITEGNYDRKILVDTGDEIGQIGEAINSLTKKIKDNISDLKDYQGKMKEINVEIQKRVSVLSNLLLIGELISSLAKLDSILELILAKLSGLYDDGFAALYSSTTGGDQLSLRASDNLKNKTLLNAKIKEGKGVLGKAISRKKHVLVDASSKFSPEDQEFKAEYKCENIVAFPVRVRRREETKMLLIVGNNVKNFTYTNDDIEMIKVFVEQISVAVENDALMKKAESLEIQDELTKLFNKPYMAGRLKEEIERSVVSQRPCSFILVDIDDFTAYQQKKGQPQGEVALKKIAHCISGFSGSLGRAGRLERDTFGLIMPEVNKKEALEIAEKITKEVRMLELSSEEGDHLTVSSGVSENPLDGSSADEILEKAKSMLKEAKKTGKNKVAESGV